MLSSSVCRVSYDWLVVRLQEVAPGLCAQPEKEPACQHRLDIRDAGSIRGFRRSPAGERGNPLQCSCLENPIDRGAWQVLCCV